MVIKQYFCDVCGKEMRDAESYSAKMNLHINCGCDSVSKVVKEYKLDLICNDCSYKIEQCLKEMNVKPIYK